MFGTLRLILAVLVALSHIQYTIHNLNPGASAVIGFYIVSGFVMTAQLRTFYPDMRSIPNFFLDRFLRIYPQYLLFLLLATAFLAIRGILSAYLSPDMIWKMALSNLLIIPLNYFMLNDAWSFIPPAWSLGAEVQFYILVPFLLAWRIRPYAVIGSLIIFSMAWLGILTPDVYGFRLLPGVLFVFLTGSVLYDYIKGAKRLAILLIALYACVAGLFFIVRQTPPRPDAYYLREVFLGYLIGVPLVLLLSLCKRRTIDEVLGNCAYGTFLCHFLVKWTAPSLHLFEPKASPGLYLLVSVSLGALGFYAVERPLTRLRHRRRAGVK
jgi:peptidoglycan/LPS O-acetylase OafA/YrhL